MSEQNPAPSASEPVAHPTYTAGGSTAAWDSTYASAPRTNTLAIIAFILAFLIPGIPAVITGHIALAQIRRTRESGHGLALAATILGWVVTAFVILGTILAITLFSWLFTNGHMDMRDWQNA